MAEHFLTLTEVSETVNGTYPIVVRVLPKEYEIPEQSDLPGDIEIVLEKPKCLKFAHVQISAFRDERQTRKDKGNEFVKERNEYVGKEFLIPLCFPGTLKLLNKQGQLGRYSSMNQVKQDLPRYIRIEQETVYTPPGESHAKTSLDTGTKLEVKSLHNVEGRKYVKCKSVKTSREYIFRDDFAITCSAVDDTRQHTLLHLAVDCVLLPKLAQFQTVWADDIVMQNDDEASKLLTLTEGPIKILKTSAKMTFFIVWLKSKGTRCKTVALIPKKSWDNQLVQIKPFDDEKKKEYIKTQFGGLDSSFVTRTLYTMKPDESSVIWLREPYTFGRGEEPTDYENVEKKLSDYENAFQKQEEPGSDHESVGSEDEEDTEEDADDYEEPICQAPPVQHRISHEKVHLPFHKPKRMDSHVLKTIKEKAMLGFDKVHEQILKHAKSKHKNTSVKNKKKDRMTATTLMTLQDPVQHEKQNISGNVSQDESQARPGGDRGHSRHSMVTDRNINRPLPILPPKTSVNVTDDDKLYLYDQVEDKEEAFQKKVTENERETPDVLPNLLDRNKISRPDQSCDDFYSYTVQELEECFKMCGLSKLAGCCISNRLDGAFFRKFDMNELKSDPFLLGNIEVIKVKKIIECGWRPKAQNE